jgi:hypothetical protein
MAEKSSQIDAFFAVKLFINESGHTPAYKSVHSFFGDMNLPCFDYAFTFTA